MTQVLPSHMQHSGPHEAYHCAQPLHRGHTEPDSVQASSSVSPEMHNQQKCHLISLINKMNIQQISSSNNSFFQVLEEFKFSAVDIPHICNDLFQHKLTHPLTHLALSYSWMFRRNCN